MKHPSHDAMLILFDRARDTLTVAELESLADLPDAAVFDLLNLSRVCGSLAALVAADDHGKGTGCFRESSEFFSLLAHVSTVADACAGMVAVGDGATALLADRRAGRKPS